MAKLLAFDVLSNVVCSTPGCNQHLKLRIVIEHPKYDKCYKCFKKAKRREQHRRKATKKGILIIPSTRR